MVLSRDFVPPEPFDFAATWFATLGPGGNTTRVDDRGRHYAANTPEGPVAVTVVAAAGSLRVEAWGTGAARELDAIPIRLGFDDPGPGSTYDDGPLAPWARRARGLRLGATQRPFEAIVPTILGQRVTSGEAKQGYRSLVHAFGEPAPGPIGLRLPPTAARLASLEYEDFHRYGIERSRAAIVMEAARRSRRIDEAATMDPEAAAQRLRAIRGIGGVDRRPCHGRGPWRSGCSSGGGFPPSQHRGLAASGGRPEPMTSGCSSCSSPIGRIDGGQWS